MSRSLADLTPQTREKCIAFLDACENRGIRVMIVETLRANETHEAYYAQGRKPLQYVNLLRRKAGLWTITARENKRITWTRTTNHYKGTAFDFALLVNGWPTWNIKTDMNDNEIRDYDEVGQIGESVGLTWGGRFKDRRGNLRPDRPHLQNDTTTIVE